MVSLSEHQAILPHQLTIQELTERDRNCWDVLIQSSSAGCFMQSWAWADFKELEGYKTFRYGLFSDGKLVGGCIFTFFREAMMRICCQPQEGHL